MSAQKAVVIDNGTGYTKLGYAGNQDPQFVFPTAIATRDDGPAAGAARGGPRGKSGMSDLDFYIGYEAYSNKAGYNLQQPMKHGKVENWDLMERLWEQCFFKYLRCEPEEQLVMLTEPPMNAPENREYAAEVMFETFNVRGLNIAVQAVLALCASWNSRKASELGLQGSTTGTVIDSGDGVTHVIPVVDGYVIGSAIKHIPLAGKDITQFVRGLLMERETTIPAEDAMLVAQKIKEEYSYLCKDIADEFADFDRKPQEKMVRYKGKSSRGVPFECDVAYEMFLGPELFFSPEIFSDLTTPLPVLVDGSIQHCPIDSRRALYRNIVLSGGSTMFKNFGRRLQRDIKHMVDERVQHSIRRAGASAANANVQPPEVNVISHGLQRYAVWYGGSQLASMPEFYNMVVKKAEYEERGPSVCRQNRFVFSGLTV